MAIHCRAVKNSLRGTNMNSQLYGGQLYGQSADSFPRIRWLVHGVL
jgi:hypothetical protein